MSTNDTAQRTLQQWAVPGVAVAAGIAYLVAGILGDEVGFGIATAFAGSVVIAAVLIGFLVEIARGQDGEPYAALGALAGIAYLAGLA